MGSTHAQKEQELIQAASKKNKRNDVERRSHKTGVLVVLKRPHYTCPVHAPRGGSHI
jgi:hypothetical protein